MRGYPRQRLRRPAQTGTRLNRRKSNAYHDIEDDGGHAAVCAADGPDLEAHAGAGDDDAAQAAHRPGLRPVRGALHPLRRGLQPHDAERARHGPPVGGPVLRSRRRHPRGPDRRHRALHRGHLLGRGQLYAHRLQRIHLPGGLRGRGHASLPLQSDSSRTGTT